MITSHSVNLIALEEIISKYGWPGKSFVRPKGNNTVWLVIQHADLPVQLKYLPILEHSIDIGESQAFDLAFLKDRIFMQQDKKQLYGSQISMN